MKKKEALAIFHTYIINGVIEQDIVESGALEIREEVERQLRIIARNNVGMKNALLELGISILAKTYLKDSKLESETQK